MNQRLVTASLDLNQLEKQHKQLAMRFRNSYANYFATLNLKLQHSTAQLAQLNPQSVLERGYSITYTQQGEIVRDSKQLQCGDRIQVKFARGNCDATVNNTTDS